MNLVELLAPARDLASGQAAINCGADAVYVGAARFGAREAAGNALEEIEALARYAHRYWARVYVTVNTLLHDEELPAAQRLIQQLYEIGADAVIFQDAALLAIDLPPIALFASTQMHNHTPERVAFLEKVGVQRAILARELSLDEIRAIRAAAPSIELESFIHGALCVSYSGQCYASYAIGGRSGNRGQCAQPCRRPYRLIDANGQTLAENQHLLSLRDLNLSGHLGDLLAAGVRSFKIEGRLKDRAYVMNVVAHYRQQLDALLGAAALTQIHPAMRAGAARDGHQAAEPGETRDGYQTMQPGETRAAEAAPTIAKPGLRRAGMTGPLRGPVEPAQAGFVNGGAASAAGFGEPTNEWAESSLVCGEPTNERADPSPIDGQPAARKADLPPISALRPASSGRVLLDFTPDPAKTFNRGFTTYFLHGRGAPLAAWDTPKPVGEPLGRVASLNARCFTLDSGSDLRPGDGLCWLAPSAQDGSRALLGTLVQRVAGSQIFTARLDGLTVGETVYRNHDHAFLAALEKSQAGRRIGVRFSLAQAAGSPDLTLRVEDSDGVSAEVIWPGPHPAAERPDTARETILRQLSKLGGSGFECLAVSLPLAVVPFLPVGGLNALRRAALEALTAQREQRRPRLPARRLPVRDAVFPTRSLSFEGNVLNRTAEQFYRSHGVTHIEPAAESGLNMSGRKVMTTRYCLRQQLGACPKYAQPGQGPVRLAEPLTLLDEHGSRYPLRFNCAQCIMEVYHE